MNITSLCMQLPQWLIGVIFVSYMVIEYFLGKSTQRSALGFIENTFKGFFGGGPTNS